MKARSCHISFISHRWARWRDPCPKALQLYTNIIIKTHEIKARTSFLERIGHFSMPDSFILKTSAALRIKPGSVSKQGCQDLDVKAVNSPKRTTDDRLPAPPLCKSRTQIYQTQESDGNNVTKIFFFFFFLFVRTVVREKKRYMQAMWRRRSTWSLHTRIRTNRHTHAHTQE